MRMSSGLTLLASGVMREPGRVTLPASGALQIGIFVLQIAAVVIRKAVDIDRLIVLA